MVTDVLIIQLREENVKTQSALKEAVERRLVREGEVSILRKTIEKASYIPSNTNGILIHPVECSKSCRSDSATESRERKV